MHYVKKQFFQLDNFSFEITNDHLRLHGKTSADLAANFKLTNQMAAFTSKQCFKTAVLRKNLERNSKSFYSKNVPFVEEKWPDMNNFSNVIEAKPSNLLDI